MDEPEGYSRADRIRSRSDYRRVQKLGRRVHTAHFIIVLCPRGPEEDRRRLGITVTRKVAHAVGRNRIKRVVREVFRRNRSRFPAGFDVVFIAKPGADALGYPELFEEVTRAEGAMRGAARRARPAGPAEERA